MKVSHRINITKVVHFNNINITKVGIIKFLIFAPDIS